MKKEKNIITKADKYKVVVIYDKDRRLVDCMKNILLNRKNFVIGGACENSCNRS